MWSAIARVIEVMHEDRHGSAETTSGLSVTFHELSVAGGLSCLAVGDEVALILDETPNGKTMEARAVRRTGRHASWACISRMSSAEIQRCERE